MLFAVIFVICMVVGFGGAFALGPYLGLAASAFVGWVAALIIIDGGTPARTPMNLLAPLSGVVSGYVLEVLLDPLAMRPSGRMLCVLATSNFLVFFAVNAYTLWRSPQGRGYPGRPL